MWHGAFGALFDDEHAHGMHRIEAPALLAWGALDAFASRADQDTILGRLRGSRLAVYEGAGHALHWEEPARFAADVAAFAQAIAAAR